MHSTSKSSGDLGVSNAQITLGQAIVTGVSIKAAAADVVVILYDNNSAAGVKILDYTHDFSLEGLSVYIPLPSVKCKTGLWGVVTGSGAVVIVHYK